MRKNLTGIPEHLLKRILTKISPELWIRTFNHFDPNDASNAVWQASISKTLLPTPSFPP
jgi:hypothetical protein